MRSFIALMRREALEHKGPFVYAPVVVFVILVITTLGIVVTGNSRFELWIQAKQELGLAAGQLLERGGAFTEQTLATFGIAFSIGYAGVAYFWWVFLLIALFFYCADAFNADRRNNAMLFWKSMPQSDLKILGSKLGAAMSLFPAMIFGAVLASGILVFFGIALALLANPIILLPTALDSYVQVTLSAIAWFVLGILWYAPWLAWVGLLSTLVGRWSIPLAFLIPALAVILENLFLESTGTEWGFIAQFLQQRFNFGPDGAMLTDLATTMEGPMRIDAVSFVTVLLNSIDWAQMAGGLVVAAIFMFIASQYRRRALAGA